MNCPGTERLLEYLFDELSAADHAETERHLNECNSCREELTTMGSLDGLLRELPPPLGSTTPAVSKCLDEADIAAYLDKAGSFDERAFVEKHLVECVECFDLLLASSDSLEADERGPKTVPVTLLNQAIALEKKKETVFDIAVCFLQDALQVIRTSGLLIPGPELAVVRGQSQAQASNILRLRDFMGEIKIDVELERVRPDACQITVALQKKEVGTLDGVRVALSSGDAELASYRTRGGQATFKDVLPGKYGLVVSQNETELGIINLEIEAQP